MPFEGQHCTMTLKPKKKETMEDGIIKKLHYLGKLGRTLRPKAAAPGAWTLAARRTRRGPVPLHHQTIRRLTVLHPLLTTTCQYEKFVRSIPNFNTTSKLTRHHPLFPLN